jgi:NAD(P)-dependent dehydrogenase (short-subunit alcohol dehydrogenase family)
LIENTSQRAYIVCHSYLDAYHNRLAAPAHMSEEASLFGLNDKKALVVGGGQGMGEESSIWLAKVGCDVAVLDSVGERAIRVAEAVKRLGRDSYPIVGDILDERAVNRLVAEAEEKLGGLDVVVTIVGSAAFGSLLDTTAQIWDQQQSVNLRYFFLVAREAARSMLRRNVQGAITCVSSVSGLQSAPNHAAYGAAKAGLVNLVRSMAVEWSPNGIRVNAVAPGTIATPRLPVTPIMLDKIKRSKVPLGRPGIPTEIAKAILFLSSDLASYVTGHTLYADGGWMSVNIWPYD